MSTRNTNPTTTMFQRLLREIPKTSKGQRQPRRHSFDELNTASGTLSLFGSTDLVRGHRPRKEPNDDHSVCLGTILPSPVHGLDLFLVSETLYGGSGVVVYICSLPDRSRHAACPTS
ncbi:unnamed protein product [Ectocarpus fasciculatus]